jgi:hypothetical protein
MAVLATLQLSNRGRGNSGPSGKLLLRQPCRFAGTPQPGGEGEA